MEHKLEQTAALIKQQVSSGHMLFDDAHQTLQKLGIGSSEAYKYLIGGQVRRENIDLPERY